MSPAPWPAPAKLNLFLHVTGRRADGYHELETLFQLVDLEDELRIVVRRDGVIARSGGAAGVPAEEDLVVRAARLLRARAGDPGLGAEIDVAKRIPVGGGLGGGSSDAAAALHAVERLFDLDLSDRLRYDVALAVGSDVPFFLWPGPQLAMGRGQVLKEVELPALHLVIAMPGIGLSTAAVYKWRDEDAEVTLKDFAPRARLLSSRIRTARTARDVAALVANDLEPSVVARKEQVGGLIERLRGAGALAAAMTGSGAAVFGVFGSEAKARQAREAVAPARAWYVTDLQPGPEGGRTGRDEG